MSTDAGSRRILRAGSNSALLAEASVFLARHGGREVMVVAASLGAANELARRAGANGSLGVHRSTLAHLAASLAAPALAGKRTAPLGALGTEALAARVLHLERRSLTYFTPVVDTPGFPRALAATLSELRLQAVDLASLAASGAPGADLAVLARAYAGQLEEAGLADLASIAALASEAGENHFAGMPLLLLDVAPRSRRMEALVARLTSMSPDVFALTLAADTESAAALERALGVAPADVSEPAPANALEAVRRRLFAPAANDGPAPAGDSLELFSAPGEDLECVEIARRILALAAAGTPLDRVAILPRGPERYQPLIEEALRRAGLPGYFSRGTIRPDPAGRAFLALLACAAEGCSATRFAEYLSLAQAPPLDARGAPVKDERAWAAGQDDLLSAFQAPDTEAPETDERLETVIAAPIGWEKLLVDAAVVGGAGRWARRLLGFENELELRLRDADDERREPIARRLQELRRLQRFALPLIDLLAALPRRALWGEWIERLGTLARTALRSPEAVLGVLAELEPMSETGPADLGEVTGVLGDRLRFLRADPGGSRYGRVFVGSLDEARGREFDVVFVPGLAEGLFPRRASEDPLLLDDFRAALDHALATQDTRIARERLLLHAAAAAATAQFVVSYPRMDATQGRPRVPSFYALEVVRAAEGALPELRGFERRAAEASRSRLGWPAPADPERAIDPAEYDLAVLDAVARGARGGKGAGRYLVDANPHLARSLRFRWSRWSSRTWRAADGLVAEGAALELIRTHRLTQRAYSPTALQHYSACPYRFYLSAVAGLREREESVPLEQLDPRTRGALFHRVQFEAFRELEAAGLLPVDRERLGDALDIVDATLNRTGAEYFEQLAPAIPRVWDNEIEDLRTDLRGWIRHIAVPGLEWRPFRFELAFGLEPRQVSTGAPRDAASTVEEVEVAGGVRLRGSVDLVERSTRRDALRVVDHKTGKPPDPLPGYVGGGAVLQPMLYALAVEKMLGTPVEMGLLSYCTQRGGYTTVKIEASATARERIAEALELIDAAVSEGFLPAAPSEGACARCDYRPVCGPYEEQRSRRKNQARLRGLSKLRELP